MAGIKELFRNRSVLITGASGFMGKVLLSKLLRCCPDIHYVYILIRPNRGKTAVQRLSDMFDLPLFDSVRDMEDLRSKVVGVEGDMTQLRLGLSDKDYGTIVDEVSFVFHVAATVRFNEPLNQAILLNTRGTREVVNLCLDMKQLLVLLHVSTTYSNCERRVVEEKVYPSPVNWKDAITLVEKMDPAVVNTFSTKYIGVKPNTYTFTKSLAEHVVWDYRHELPIVIFRPSIVVSTWKDPVPGWLDNLNGPVGMMMGAGQGVIRVSMCDPDVVPDYMPVDIAIRAILVAVYHRATSSLGPEEFVFNCASTSSSISNSELIKLGVRMVKDVPLTDALWDTSDDVTTSKTYFTVKSWFAHLLPALIIDFVLRMLGKEPRLTKIQLKIFTAVSALSYFTCNEWKFQNNKFMSLLSYILPEDMEELDFDFSDIDPSTYFRQSILGARIYLLHDPIENIPSGRKKAERLYWLDKIVKTGVMVLFVWSINLPYRFAQLYSSTSTYFDNLSLENPN